MGPGKVRLRVHFAVVGSEVLRVAEPMKILDADVGLLLTLSKTDRSGLNAEKIKHELKNQIKIEVMECSSFDTSVIVDEIGSVVTAYPHHEYMFNVSTGPRTASIAGVIGGMFWRLQPYYIAINDQAKPVHGEGDFPVSGAPKFIPTFQIPVLDQGAVQALEFIAGAGQPIAKHTLIAHMVKIGQMGPRQRKEVTSQALYGQVDSILDRLYSWGFVEREGHGKQARITVTESGIEGRKMFFHMLNPRKKPIDLLASKMF
jgi:uncharacterized protein DUF6293